MSQHAFKKLLSSLTLVERERVLKVAIAYGLPADDPAWLILAINQSGLIAMEKTLAELANLHKKEIFAFEQKAENLANMAMENAAQMAIQKISDTLATTAQSLCQKRELKVGATWVICAAVIGVSFYVGISVFTYRFLESSLYKKGFTDAYQLASDEKARASWANTAAGKIAFKLSQATDIALLATCNNPGSGWRLNDEGNLCYPYLNSKEMVYGWGVPKNLD